MMDKRIVGVVLASALVMMFAPTAEAATPVPGRFCKTADAGKVVKTSKYGPVKCKMKNGRYRWAQI